MKKSFLLILILFSISVSGHPHMFVDVFMEMKCQSNTLSEIEVTWKFDEAFSQSILMDYDKNKNRKLEKDEVAKIKKEAFSYTAEQNYFTHITAGRKRLKKHKISNFTASVEKNRLVYRFFIQTKLSLTKFDKISIGVYDSTYYVDFGIAAKNISYKSCRKCIKRVNYEKSGKKIYMNQIAVPHIVITTGKK